MPPNIFSMSDEELMNLTPEKIQELSQSSDTTGSSADSGDIELDEGDDAGQGTGEAQGTAGAASAVAGDAGQVEQEEELEEDEDQDPAASTTTGSVPVAEPAKADAAKPAAAVDGAVSNTPPTTESNTAESAVDYKSEYEKLTAPFVANGREIRVKTVDDAISLMQMGANYNKKMAALKPNLKLLRLLENNNLLSEEKINFLIDLDKKTPGAVNKLITESGLDPLDLGANKDADYKPTARTVDDREIELDEVLGDLSTTPTYKRTIDIVSAEWDTASKRAVAEAPQLLRVINDHVRTGVYDLIKAEVESERMFGRLQGISDIEAYRQVGDAINARGGFAHLNAQGQQTQQQKQVVAPKPKQANDEKLNEKRRAAAAAKPAATTPKPAKEFNPLALSDEEFAKAASRSF